jgi:transposase
MDQRLQFLSSYQKEEMSVADLCREYGISRPTGYRWINRYNETGPEGLVDRNRRPHGCSHATLEPVENAIFALRAKHPSWGARKLKARLEMLQPDVVWPAASTFGNILSRAGLTSPQKKRKRTTPCSEPFSQVTGPNQLWCMDFKGYFATGDGKRCDPFTITDAHSRYLIRCQIVSRYLQVLRCVQTYLQYGNPEDELARASVEASQFAGYRANPNTAKYAIVYRTTVASIAAPALKPFEYGWPLFARTTQTIKAFSNKLKMRIGVRHSTLNAAAIMKTPIRPTMIPQC